MRVPPLGTRIAAGQSPGGCGPAGRVVPCVVVSPAVALPKGGRPAGPRAGGCPCAPPACAAGPARPVNSDELDRDARLRAAVRRLIADCRRYGASKADLDRCSDLADLERLRDRLLREAMSAPRRTA